jgi:hypothetical protein
MVTFASDYAFGTANEAPTLPRVEEYLKTKLIHRGGKSVFDYDNGKNVYADLKTRRITHNQWPTALIGANKVHMASLNPKTDFWFFYNYTDGLFAIKYEKEKFAKYECKKYKRGDREDYHNRPAETYFIPYEDLIRIAV